MSTLARLLRDQRGVALPLAMFSLVILSVMLLAFLSMAGMEPQVSANLGDTTRARFVAEAGVEWAFDTLVNPAVTWTTVLTNAAVGCPANPNGCRLGAANQTLPGLAQADGTYTVLVRNDTQVGDNVRTGLATIDARGGPNTDTNGRLFITATGTFNGVTRTVQVVIRRPIVPDFPAAVNLPGLQADMLLQNADRFRIDGRDYQNSTIDAFNVNGGGAAEGTPTGGRVAYAKLAIGVAAGNQLNIPGDPTFED